MSTLKQSIKLSFVAILVVAFLIGTTMSNAKLLRRPLYDDGYDGMYGIGGGMIPTGERAIVTVRGTRSPYDGTVPSKITIEDNSYRGSYPRGIYDRFDKFGGRGRMYPELGFGGGFNGGYLGGPYNSGLMGGVPYGYGR